jgi:uncharacterized repeat protein (TIGR03803 family)
MFADPPRIEGLIMRGKQFSIGSRATLTIFAVAVFVTSACAATEKVLHSFNGLPKSGPCYHGCLPYAGLIFDASGNLYGTTNLGGSQICGSGCGTVFELTPKAGGGWTEKVLHAFNKKDGASPQGSLIFDASGNLYGVTGSGGAYGYGTVFELTPRPGGGWTEKLLHNFNYNGKDGIGPVASLIFDVSGNLYGMTAGGGAYGYGTVFELTPKGDGGWTERVLHSFDLKATDGANPVAGLVFGASGNLYGTTRQGGGGNCPYGGCGTVFELKPKGGGGWTETVLHSFDLNPTDGVYPEDGLVFDGTGNLYGTTSGGGGHSGGYCSGGCGTVFELTPQASGLWKEKILHVFNNKDGYGPFAALILDTSGNLYGTTVQGGFYGFGLVFELTPTAGGRWMEKVLHGFGPENYYQQQPYSGLIFDASGNLYGTTLYGGARGGGTVYEIRP